MTTIDDSGRITLDPAVCNGRPVIKGTRIAVQTDFHAFLARIWPQVESLLPAHKLVNVYADRIEAVN